MSDVRDTNDREAAIRTFAPPKRKFGERPTPAEISNTDRARGLVAATVGASMLNDVDRERLRELQAGGSPAAAAKPSAKATPTDWVKGLSTAQKQQVWDALAADLASASPGAADFPDDEDATWGDD